MTGYTTEGTLSRTLLTHPETVEDMRGNVQVRRQTVNQNDSPEIPYQQCGLLPLLNQCASELRV
jgi:hypothetical protein